MLSRGIFSRKNKRNRQAAKRSKTKNLAHRLSPYVESLETRNLLTVSTFQQGVLGYAGTQDTILYSRAPSVNFGTETGMSVDQQDIGGVRQGLLRFDNLFANNGGPIPLGSTINSATLTVSVFNDSNSSMQMSMYRMKTNWDQSLASWNTFGAIGGVQASEGEVEGLPPDAILFDAGTGIKTYNVATSLKHWASGESNLGWLFDSAATNGWDFNTSEASLADRPLLTVDYTPPSGNGQFQFINLTPIQAEGDAGTTQAILQVARLGGTTGAVSVNYTIAAGTAGGGDFVAAGPITLNFAANETVKNIPVTINGDTELEGLETVTVTLSAPTGGATIAPGLGTATLTIADDDALINEVMANVANAVDETNREYIELIGTPGASLNGYYFTVFEGEEEENGGTGSGRADLVMDLTGQSFGANGILVITPTAWAYTPAVGTNVFATAQMNGAGGVLEDSSQTYALIRSPLNPIVQGTDYDTVGAYENATATAIGTGVGILDQLPVGAQIMDSVGTVEGGGGDRDRVATLQHPGIHVHQPDGEGGNTSSDGLTRRLGERTPNSIGVWYNGDIPNGAVPVAYANGTTSISVVTPPGAQLTPGAPNILRTIGFAATDVSVDESSPGSVTLMVTRVGDTSTAITVQYATVSGSALSGLDFTGTTGTLSFGIGVATLPLVVPILTDAVPEGFETFSVNLTNPTNPFLFTAPSATVTINDADVLVRTFQDGVNGYAGTADATLNSVQPTDPFGGAGSVSVDEQVGALTGESARPTQALLRFDDLFGAGGNQVPAGSQIFSAFLTLNVNNPTDAAAQVRFFRMLQNWDESSATWDDPQGTSGGSVVHGVTPDDVEATAEPDTVVTNPGGSGLINIPLNRDTIQAWANGALPNLGWSIVSDTGNDWNFNSSDSFDPALLPKLTILYTAPTGAGTFGFAHDTYTVNENGTASIKVIRTGGSNGTATVNYSITPDTGSLADITGSATGTLNFADGELFETITVPINNDASLERNENLNMDLTGAVNFSRATAVLTIRDNDFNTLSPTLLLNELYINSPGLDSGREYIELAGLANAGLGSLYLAVIDGDVGPGEGAADLVVDLGPYLNGNAGFSLISAANNFDFNIPIGATQIPRPELNFENVDNDSATYALLYSPNTNLATSTFDYDWDNDGILELPAGVVFIDSIAIQDNGATDRSYGPVGNTIESNSNPNLYVPDAASRSRGNTTANSAAAWFHGDLIAAGDDPLVYNGPSFVSGLPSPGAAATPGEINTGTTVQSPLVSLTSVTPNFPVGSVTLTFSGPITQLLAGGGAAGVSITKPDGSPFPQVNVDPVVTGFGTNTLNLTFTGPAVVGGQLPSGNYRLNFVGNSLIGNGRAVDAANTSTAIGSNTFFDFTAVSAPASTVVNKQLFYNQSSFDGNNINVNTTGALNDDTAIATDKTAYAPGSGSMSMSGSVFTGAFANNPASFRHVSSFTRGINGLMIDITGSHPGITASDFIFKTGNNNSPSTWATAAAPTSVTVRTTGVGLTAGNTRVEIIWPNQSIRNTWLEVMVKANVNTGLADTSQLPNADGIGHIFFFGNRVGDSGSGDTAAFLTTATDEIGARNNPGSAQPITNRFDYNKDGLVTATDQITSRNNAGSIALLNISDPPATPPVVPAMSWDRNSLLSGLNSQSIAAPRVESGLTRRLLNRIQAAEAQQAAHAQFFQQLEQQDTRKVKPAGSTGGDSTPESYLDGDLLALLVQGLETTGRKGRS